MKKKLATILTATLVAASLTACGNKLSVNNTTVELGDDLKGHYSEFVTLKDKKDIDKVKFDVSKVDIATEGTYDASATFDGKTKNFKITVKDTVAPEVTVKKDIVIQTSNPLFVTSVIDTVTELSQNVSVKFETVPETEEAVAESTETTETPEGKTENLTVGGVNLEANSSITYTEKGTYDNAVIVTDKAGNETKISFTVEVKDQPTIEGLTDISVTAGDEIDFSAGVVAKDSDGNDITDRMGIDTESVNKDVAGEYTATYSVTDDNDLTKSSTRVVVVNEKPQEEKPQEVETNKDNGNTGSKKPSSGNSGSTNSGSNNSGSTGSGSTSSNNSGSNSSGSGNSGNSGSVAENNGTNGSEQSDPNIEVFERNGFTYTVDKRIYKYDTAYAYKLHNSPCTWANGEPTSSQELVDADLGNNREAALYILAAGNMTQEWFDQMYGAQ